MRIYLFTEHYPSTFKPYLDSQFAEFVRSGHEITVLAYGKWDGVLNEVVLEYELAQKTRYFPTTARTAPRFLPRAALRTLRDPRRAFVAMRAERGPLKNRLAGWVRAMSLPAEPPELCLIHGTLPATLMGWLRDVYPGVPVALYYHGGELPHVPQLPPERVAEAFAMADLVFTNTRASADHAAERGCRREALRVLPVGFAIEEYVAPEPRSYRPGGVLRLLTASRMSEEKGHRFALEAVRLLVEAGVTDFEYTLVGEGYERAPLERYVAEHGLGAWVRFTGTLSTAALHAELAAADAVVLPSIQAGTWVENQACVVQEAMLMKALVVATTTGGVPESLAPELRRFLVPPGEPAAIAAAIAGIRACSNDEMRMLGEAGRRFAEARYDIRRLNEELLHECAHHAARPAQALVPGGLHLAF